TLLLVIVFVVENIVPCGEENDPFYTIIWTLSVTEANSMEKIQNSMITVVQSMVNFLQAMIFDVESMENVCRSMEKPRNSMINRLLTQLCGLYPSEIYGTSASRKVVNAHKMKNRSVKDASGAASLTERLFISLSKIRRGFGDACCDVVHEFI
ncbi:hypothetical protein, partial [Alkalibacillus salilacus]